MCIIAYMRDSSNGSLLASAFIQAFLAAIPALAFQTITASSAACALPSPNGKTAASKKPTYTLREEIIIPPKSEFSTLGISADRCHRNGLSEHDAYPAALN